MVKSTKIVSAFMAEVKKEESHGYYLLHDRNDPLWISFSNFFKYAAGIKGRDIASNNEHKIRFARYFNQYRKDIELKFNCSSSMFGIPQECYCQRIPTNCLEETMGAVINRTATIREILQMHVNIASFVVSAQHRQPIYFFTHSNSYGENAIRLGMRNNNIEDAIIKAVRRTDFALLARPDFIHCSSETIENIKSFLELTPKNGYECGYHEEFTSPCAEKVIRLTKPR